MEERRGHPRRCRECGAVLPCAAEDYGLCIECEWRLIKERLEQPREDPCVGCHPRTEAACVGCQHNR